MSYEVLIVPAVRDRIRQQAEYIAIEQKAPRMAARWLARVYDQVETLAEMPRRCPIPPEAAWLDYELRCLLIWEFALFFTVIDETSTVWVVHAKHGRQLSQPDDFPADLEGLEE